jgi:hypothetical protein
MLAIKHLAFAFLLSLWFAPASAADTDDVDIRANFANFWSAMRTADYRGAAGFVHPLDLAQLRTLVLPVFVKGGSSQNGEIQTLVEMFFNAVPKERRSQLSGPEVFIQMNKMVANAEPALAEAYKLFTPEILEIKRDAANKASVRYKLTVKGESIEETQPVGRLNGRWYLHMADSPASVAAKFRGLMDQ